MAFCAHTHTQNNNTEIMRQTTKQSRKQSIKSRELTVISVALAACYQYLTVVVPGRAAASVHNKLSLPTMSSST